MIYKEIEKYDNLKDNELFNSILWYNNIKTKSDLEKIEKSDFPFSLNNTEYFIKRINKAKENDEIICIIGDYDCDGVCATSILKLFLDSLKIKNIYIIGNRETDGYGMNNSLIDTAKSNNATLIITVDNGIKCYNEVSYANSLDIEVIVTDHHQPEKGYIPNTTIYNPHYNNEHLIFKDYCGAFVILTLIYNYLKSNESLIKSSKEFMYELYELAALATISDMMPLYYFNRKIVAQFIKNINSNNIYNLGIKMLIEYISKKEDIKTPFNSEMISLKIVPIINAPGRLSDANILVSLFIDPKIDIIEECIKINEDRKIKTRIAVSKLKTENTKVNILFDESIPEGIIGIVAAQIKEKTKKPTIILTQTKSGQIKGSGRSIEGFNLLNSISEILKQYDLATYYGGHEKALGLTLKNLDCLKTFKKLASNIPYQEIDEITYYIECKNPLNQIFEAIEMYNPYGQSFNKPIFHLYGKPINIKVLKEKHSSFTIYENGIYYNCILFNNIIEANNYDFYFSVSKEVFNNQVYYKCMIIDYTKRT